jgi:hypothetical protein
LHSNFDEDQLAAQLFAAELNAVNGGANNCISETISSTNALMKSQNYNGPTNILGTSRKKELHNQILFYKD